MKTKINVYGKVQGVFFRYNTKKAAEKLGIKGWVRNIKDGSVEIIAEGEKEKIKEFTEWIKKSPGSSVVKKIDIKEEKTKEKFSGFSIRL